MLARRRPNRGMEGLAYDAGADMLFGIMQSPLYNPDASTKDTAVFCRIVALRPTRRPDGAVSLSARGPR